jgi:LytR_cpsA_psr family
MLGLTCSFDRRTLRAVALAVVLIGANVISANAGPRPAVALAAEQTSDPAANPCVDLAAVAPQGRPDSTGRPIVFDQFIGPFADAAASRRARLASADPGYWHRVDADLNAHRVNVALLGYGEEHDQTYADMGVSATILTLNLDTWHVDAISLSRDIRVPELEDQSALSPPRWPQTLRAAYRARGFDGIRPILEDATGLAIDFQIVMKDVFLKNYLNEVSGPVELIVPKDFHTNVYRLDGQDHGEDFLAAGRQTLSPDQAMTFVLAETLDPVGRDDERSYRKDLLLKTLACGIRQRFADRDAGFALSLGGFMLGELKDQNLITDFDFQLVSGGLAQLAQAFVTSFGDVDASFPQLGSARELVIHDPAFGDGGVRRVHYMATQPEAADNELVRNEIQMGSLAPYMLIPVGGNPYASDLVADYWGAVRQLIRARVLADN